MIRASRASPKKGGLKEEISKKRSLGCQKNPIIEISLQGTGARAVRSGLRAGGEAFY